MSRKGGHKKIIAFVVVVALIAGGLAYTKGFWPFERAQADSAANAPSASHVVGAKGGTFAFRDGLTIVVPPGAVTKQATLSVTAPTVLSAKKGPLASKRTAGVQFDVSLTSGDKQHIQPLKPLSLSVPMRAPFMPSGVNNLHALPYTADGAGGYALLAAKAAGQRLSIEAYHLSPKYITYVSDQALLDSFKVDKTATNADACKQQTTVSGQKIKFGDKSRGWSLKNDSALFACLYAGSDGYVRVGVTNRIDYILPVAATSNVRLAASTGDAETETIKLLARRIFNLSKVKAYVGLDEKIVGSIAAKDLPATIELQGDPHTYLAEAVWRALTVSVEVFIGEDSDKATKLVKTLVNSADVVGCLQDKLHADDAADWYQAMRAVTDCSGPVLEELAKSTPSLDLVKRAQAAWSMTLALTNSLVRAANGVKLQFANTLRIQVVAVAPPAPKPSLDAFVGDWFVHGSTLKIRANGSSDMTWNAGPCGESMCTGHASLTFRQVGNGAIKGTISSRWYTLADGSSYTASDISQYDDQRAVGKSVTLTRDGDYFLKSVWDGSTADQSFNPYWCTGDTPVDQQERCGA